MPIEYSHSDLEVLLAPEIARFIIDPEHRGWRALDEGNDEIVALISEML